MNEPTDSTLTDTAEPTANTEAALRDLATEADSNHSTDTTTAATDTTPSAGDPSEAAGPAADDAASSPVDDVEPGPDPAAELARLREDAARQKAEITRLTRLTSLQGGSGPGTPPAAPKRFAELSDREMETEIGRMAAEIDGF